MALATGHDPQTNDPLGPGSPIRSRYTLYRHTPSGRAAVRARIRRGPLNHPLCHGVLSPDALSLGQFALGHFTPVHPGSHQPPGGIAVRCLAPGACTNPYKHNQTLQDAPRGAPHRNPPINVGKNELSRKYRYRFDLPPTSTRRLPDTDATSTGHIRWSTPLSTCKVHLRPSADHNARRGRRDSQRDRIGNAPKSKIRARSARRKRHYKRKSLHDQRSGVNKKPRRQSLRGIPYR